MIELPQALRDNYLFRGLSSKHIDEIMAITSVRKFEGGDTIVRQFDRNTDLMIMLQGLAYIKTFGGDTIAEVGPGTVLGEISLCDDEPRSATVVSSGNSVMAVIQSEALKNLMKHDLGMRCVMMENLARLICQRLRTANVQLDGVLARS